MNNRGRAESGFTLIELLVVVLIVGILAAISIPQFMKAVETSKAEDAVGMVKSIGQANKMFRLDNSNFVTDGIVANSCNAKCCSGDTGCSETQFDRCQLVGCNYLGQQNFDDKVYTFRAGSGVTCGLGGSGGIACASRESGGPAVSTGWGYIMAADGQIAKYGTGAPDPPF